MSNENISRRAQDIHSGLRDADDPLVATTVPVTTLVGKAALLAVHIRGLDQIENIGGLYKMASNTLGISTGAIPTVLRLLADAGWLRVFPNVNNPKTIEETIPIFGSLYGTLSDQWEAMQPGELDRASVALIDALTHGPEPIEVIRSKMGLASDDFDRIVELGTHGGFVQAYGDAKSESVLYSPLYSDEHPEALLSFIGKNRERYPQVDSVLREVQARPGISVSLLANTHPIVLEMVSANVVTAPAVTSGNGQHSFLFPHVRTSQDRVIVQKARVLLACVRYGESFGAVTMIDSANVLLSRLRDRKLIGRVPHSQIGTQYRPAADLGLGYIEEENSRFRFRLYDTADNVEAVKLAIELLNGKTELPAHRVLNEEQVRAHVGETPRIILPEENRSGAAKIQRARRLEPQSKAAQKEMRNMMDDLRGVTRVR